MRKRGYWIALFLMLVLVFCLPCGALAAESRISVPFEKEMKIGWDWNDFKTASTKGENIRLAITGLVLSGNAEEKDYGSKPYSKVEKTLKALGFVNTEHSYYDKDQKNYPGMSFGMSPTKIGKKTVVVAIFRGTVNGKDVATDISSQFGDGFQTAGKNAKARLKKYLSDHKLTKDNTILFLTGHSYGAATASQVALNCSDLAAKSATYVYVYATPNNYINGTSATDYGNVYHYINIDDGVPYVPKRFDCGKRGNTLSFDYGKMSNQGKKSRFELAYYYLRGKKFANDKSLFRDHMAYNYMAILMSGLSTSEIQRHFSVVPELKSCKSTKAQQAVITWKKTDGAEGYELYMSASKTGNYRKIAEISGQSKVTYTKTGLTGGKTYYFKVSACTNPGSKKITTGQSAAKSVKIKQPKVSLKLDKTSLKLTVGASATLKATKTSTGKAVTWSSSNKKIATVNKKGKVTGKKVGSATITAKIGSAKARCKVTVSGKSAAAAAKQAYRKKLEESTYIIKFSVEDYTGDGIPDLLFSNQYGKLFLYSYVSGYREMKSSYLASIIDGDSIYVNKSKKLVTGKDYETRVTRYVTWKKRTYYNLNILEYKTVSLKDKNFYRIRGYEAYSGGGLDTFLCLISPGGRDMTYGDGNEITRDIFVKGVDQWCRGTSIYPGYANTAANRKKYCG